MPDIKISDAAPAGPLLESDLVPIAREGTDSPLNATMADLAAYVTVLASSHPPSMSNQPPTAGKMEEYARADHVHPTDTSRAPIDSPIFTGNPQAPTMLPSDWSDAVATTKFVHDLAQSGTLRTETPGIDDNSELVATTEYVQNQASTQPPLMDGVPTAGVSQRFSRGDHTHPTDTTRAAVTAVPVAASTLPTMNDVAAIGVGTTWARADHVHPSDTTRYSTSNPANYQTANQVSVTLQAYAYRDSPVFTGNPQAPQPLLTDSSASLATTAFVRTGTTTANTPASGQIGEYMSAQVLQSAAIPIAANATINLCQIALTAGDWGVSGNVGFDCSNATTLTCGISMVSAQMPSGGTPINSISVGGNSALPHANMPIPATRILLAAPAIIYLVGSANAAGTTYGAMNARRVR
jgi:hypothetical protein